MDFEEILSIDNEGQLLYGSILQYCFFNSPGVVLYCWMILLERYMKKLKGFLQQRPKLEGSMAKGYIEREVNSMP
jgi:hypothetical protein